MKNINRSILKILIISFLVLSIFSIFRTYTFYIDMRKLSIENAKKEALILKDYMMAMREVYLEQFLLSETKLDKKTLGFLPAHASSKISNRFIEKNDFNYYIRNVSDTPRNPDNLADEEELRAINFFKNNKDSKEYTNIYKNKQGEVILQFATPIITKAYCLSCHGKKEETFPIIQDLYNTAYNYKTGDLRGIVSIKIPENNIFKDTKEFFMKEFTYIIISIIFITLIFSFLYKNTTTKIKKINDTALTDALTGLNNRHFINQFVDSNCQIFSSSEDKFLAIAFIDIDHFKKVNDTFGHDVGDKVLKQFANKIRTATRKNDILCRYGGEEFILIMKDISKNEAIHKMERIRAVIEKMPIDCDCELRNITASIGLSFGKEELIKEIISLADKNLYKAKEKGRNQVVY